MDENKYAPPAGHPDTHANPPEKKEEHEVHPVEKQPETVSPQEAHPVTTPMPTYTPTQPVVTAPSQPTVQAPAAPQAPVTAPASTLPASAVPSKKNNAAIWIILILLILPALCCVCFFVFTIIFSKDQSDPFGDVPTPTSRAITVTPTPTASVTAIVTPEPPSSSAPKGFSWSYCLKLDSWFLKPTGWYTHEDTVNKMDACYVTKESIKTSSLFETGMTAYLLKDVSKTYNKDASEQAESFIKALDNGTSTVSTIIDLNDGNFKGYARYVETTSVKQYVVAVAVDKNDIMYIISFESSPAKWDTNWETYGKPIIQQLGLSEEAP